MSRPAPFLVRLPLPLIVLRQAMEGGALLFRPRHEAIVEKTTLAGVAVERISPPGRADRGDFPCDHADAGLHRTRGQMDGAVLQEEIESHCTHSVRAESVEALTLIPARRG